MIKKLIALVFSVACISQFAAAVNNEKNATVTKEEVVAIATAVQEAKDAGRSNEEIVQAMFGGLHLTDEQKKTYTKYAIITAAVLAGVAVEEVVLPWALGKSTWYHGKTWTPEFGYGKKACMWVWNRMPSLKKAPLSKGGPGGGSEGGPGSDGSKRN